MSDGTARHIWLRGGPPSVTVQRLAIGQRVSNQVWLGWGRERERPLTGLGNSGSRRDTISVNPSATASERLASSQTHLGHWLVAKEKSFHLQRSIPRCVFQGMLTRVEVWRFPRYRSNGNKGGAPLIPRAPTPTVPRCSHPSFFFGDAA